MKRWLSFAVVSLLAVSLVACGGNKTEVEVSNTQGTTTSETQATKVNNVMELNQPYTIKTESGDYILTIEKIYETKKKNEFAEEEQKTNSVVLVDYSYQNVSFESSSGLDLYIDEYAFQVMDGEGNMIKSYPATECVYPVNTPVGGKCTARMAFGVISESDTISLTFTRGSEKVATIKHKFK